MTSEDDERSGLDPREVIRRRAEAAGIPVREETAFGESSLVVDIPGGRKARAVLVRPSAVERFSSVGFENVRYLGDFDAILDGNAAIIEARISPGNRIGGSVPYLLRAIPGAEEVPERLDVDDEQLDIFDDDLEDEAAEASPARTTWRLRVTSGDEWLEISESSVLFDQLSFGRAFTLKLPCPVEATHEEALARLERVAHSFFFDLDLRYRVAFDLARTRSLRRPRKRERLTALPEYPENVYAREPLALYRYGRSAQGLPLLEFLAYYQALEYYFPYFSSEEVIKNLRTEIIDPRFDPSSERAIARLISLAKPAARATASEREQIRATVVAVVDAETVERLVAADDETRNHFCANKQPVKGVKKIQLGGDQDLRHQIADRIYDIRCRIVHAKQDGGDSGVELLLPTSSEAAALGPDLDVVRAIAQRAIVARAQRAT